MRNAHALATTLALLALSLGSAIAEPLANVLNVAAGAFHSCAITTGGGVKCWGSNSTGQLGDNSTTQRLTPVDVSGLTSGVAAVVGGHGHTCARTTGGGAKCWGYNTVGTLGNGTNIPSSVPVNVTGLTSGVAAIAVGLNHSCALTTGGGVKCWGSNDSGQLGDNSTTTRLAPVDVTGLASGVAAIAAGGQHTCAVTTGGGVKCWGRNFFGQLGDNSTTDRLAPVDVTGLSADGASIEAGNNHTCALTTGGGVKCWGNNSSGQLGDNSTTQRLTPVDVSGLAGGVAAIAVGQIHSCALTTGGGVKCWGYNFYGQLGDNSTTNRRTPVDVTGLSSGVAAIAAYDHTCAATGGGAMCWGRNDFGQLGNGTVSNSPIPVAVIKSPANLDLQASPNPSNFGVAVTFTVTVSGSAFTPTGSVTFRDGGADIGGCVAVSLASGSAGCTTSALASGDHSITAVYSGDTNNGSAISAPLTQVVVALPATLDLQASPNPSAFGVAVTFTLTASGSGGTPTGSATFKDGAVDIGGCVAVALASGSAGCTTSTLASGSHSITAVYSGDAAYANATSAPVTQVVNAPILTVARSGSGSGTVTSTPAGIDCGATCSTSFVEGTSVTLLATAASGSASSWPGCPSPAGNQCTVVMGASITVTARFDVALVTASVSAGNTHTCALATGGGMKCWGSNANGQLGDGTTISQNTPVDVSGLSSGVAAIAAGAQHTCALTTGGGVKCWGQNVGGQLGDNSTTQRLTPVDVSGLSSGVAAIGGGVEHTCALTTGGGVKCWGNNLFGQLGDNSTTTRVAPVDVSGLTSGVAAISVGVYHTCALMSGGMKCWGYNFNGQLGDNSTTNRLTPVDVSGLASGVAAIAAGGSHTCALTTGGGVKCWGYNAQGQLGDNSTTQRNAPVDVSGLTSGVAAIAPGASNTCALTTGGGAKCWGANFYGQIGDGTSDNIRTTPVDVSGLASGVAAIAVGGQYTCALTTGGVVRCWGRNDLGQLGDNSTTQRLVPADVSGGLGTPGVPRYPLTVTLAGSGSGAVTGTGINCPGDCSEIYNSGTNVTLTATPAGGSTFAGWSGGGCSGTGTCMVTMTAAASVTATFNLSGPLVARPRDLSGDGRSDILLRGPGGEVVAWLMNGNAITSATFMLGAGTGYQAKHFGDFDGDGKQDLLVVGGGGEVVMWLMNGTTVSSATLIFGGGGGYVVDKLGDFNGDGKSDILFRGPSGDLTMWLMNGATVTTSTSILAAGTGFAPVAIGDFNDDGKSDIVIAHSDGRITMWLMNGTAVASSANLLGAGTGYTVSHVGSFNNDVWDDLILKGPAGEIVMWQMNGTTIGASFLLYGGGGWSVSHVADVNGDTFDDMVLKGPAGEIVIWRMNGAAITGATLMYGGGPWQVSHVGDYNGDGNSDLLLKGPNGEIVVWIMNGSTITSATLLVGATTWAAMP